MVRLIHEISFKRLEVWSRLCRIYANGARSGTRPLRDFFRTWPCLVGTPSSIHSYVTTISKTLSWLDLANSWHTAPIGIGQQTEEPFLRCVAFVQFLPIVDQGKMRPLCEFTLNMAAQVQEGGKFRFLFNGSTNFEALPLFNFVLNVAKSKGWPLHDFFK